MIKDENEINNPLLKKEDLLLLRANLLLSEMSLMFMWQKYNRHAKEKDKIPWNIRE